jgi:hypothetical protein
MFDSLLVPEKTVATAGGNGGALDIQGAANRVFLLNLCISKIVEQEALDVSIHGSSDGATWLPKAVGAFPQKFYAGDHPLLLDLTNTPEIKFLRAQWQVNRWGRGAEAPMFEFSVTIKEVPPDILKEATAEANALA